MIQEYGATKEVTIVFGLYLNDVSTDALSSTAINFVTDGHVLGAAINGTGTSQRTVTFTLTNKSDNSIAVITVGGQDQAASGLFFNVHPVNASECFFRYNVPTRAGLYTCRMDSTKPSGEDAMDQEWDVRIY